jgi:pilus assembly protein CpaB
MSARHQRNSYPVVFGGRAANVSRRERALVVAVAGFGIALMLGVIAITNFKSDANARMGMNSASGFDPSKQLVYSLARPVRAGERVTIDNVAQVSWGRNEIPRDAVMVAQEVDGMFAKADIPSGTALARSMFAREPSMVTLPVTPGNRAVAIEVDETSGIEGHALPGTRVDIVLTYLENEGLTSKIIVQNARILSAGGDTRAASQIDQQIGTVRRSARTITLDVGVKDALEIQTARQLGRLSLFMRSSEDDKAAPILETNRNDIAGNKKATAKKDTCKAGRMLSGGKEYVVDCDGGISELIQAE